MGWVYAYKKKGESVKEFLRKQFDWHDEENGTYCQVLDCAVVGLREAYLAVERKYASGEKEVFAVVCLLDYRPYDYYLNFGYKEMDEETHPYFYNCPERILRLLTPTNNAAAKEWRDKCWERIQIRKNRPRLRKGIIIQFERPIRFQDGSAVSEFRVVDPRRRVFFDRSGYRYRLTRHTLMNVPYRIIKDFSTKVSVKSD